MTIGEKVNQLVEDYYALYEKLLARGYGKEKAVGLALYDLEVMKIEAEMAIDELKKKLEDNGIDPVRMQHYGMA